jgi:hypothetical protein
MNSVLIRNITYEQFTRWDRENNPQYDNEEYLDYKEVHSGLSSAICSYGYKETINGRTFWLKKCDVPTIYRRRI